MKQEDKNKNRLNHLKDMRLLYQYAIEKVSEAHSISVNHEGCDYVLLYGTSCPSILCDRMKDTIRNINEQIGELSQ